MTHPMLRESWDEAAAQQQIEFDQQQCKEIDNGKHEVMAGCLCYRPVCGKANHRQVIQGQQSKALLDHPEGNRNLRPVWFGVGSPDPF